jgi:hypothetical protein
MHDDDARSSADAWAIANGAMPMIHDMMIIVRPDVMSIHDNITLLNPHYVILSTLVYP